MNAIREFFEENYSPVTRTYNLGDVLGLSNSPENLITIAVITLSNGFVQTGIASAAKAENFSEVLGANYALNDAYEKLGPIFGFLTKAISPAKPKKEIPEYLKRVIAEFEELSQKADKLKEALNDSKKDLDNEQRTMMSDQLVLMGNLATTLSKRVEYDMAKLA